MGIDGVDRVERLQPDRQSPIFARVPEGEWRVAIVPGAEAVDAADRQERGPCVRPDKMKQNLEWMGAVYLGRVVQLKRNGHEELAQQEYIVRVGKELRDDQWQ